MSFPPHTSVALLLTDFITQQDHMAEPAAPPPAAQQAEHDRVRYFAWAEGDYNDAGDVAVFYATADEHGN